MDTHQVMILNFHIKDAPSFRIYLEGKSVQGHKGTKDLTWAKVGEMFLSRNDFGKFLDISSINKIEVFIKART
jgi:hypothetical protein